MNIYYCMRKNTKRKKIYIGKVENLSITDRFDTGCRQILFRMVQDIGNDILFTIA